MWVLGATSGDGFSLWGSILAQTMAELGHENRTLIWVLGTHLVKPVTPNTLSRYGVATIRLVWAHVGPRRHER